MYFDRWRFYFKLEKTTPNDLIKYEIHKLTSSQHNKPHRRYYLRSKDEVSPVIGTWRARLGYPTINVTKSMLARYTKMVQTLQAKTRECIIDNCETRVGVLGPKTIDDIV